MGLTYCEAAPGHPWHGPYHDTEYGFPSTDERILFERLVLEINPTSRIRGGKCRFWAGGMRPSL
jgi:hypothetical protein